MEYVKYEIKSNVHGEEALSKKTALYSTFIYTTVLWKMESRRIHREWVFCVQVVKVSVCSIKIRSVMQFFYSMQSAAQQQFIHPFNHEVATPCFLRHFSSLK